MCNIAEDVKGVHAWQETQTNTSCFYSVMVEGIIGFETRSTHNPGAGTHIFQLINPWQGHFQRPDRQTGQSELAEKRASAV